MSALDLLSDDERLVVRTVREFVDKDVKPVVQELEHSDTYPESLIERMKELGIYGLAVPEEYGGNPVSTPCFVLVTEELARGWMSLAGAMGGHTVVAKLLLLYGTKEQKRRYLPRLASGEVRATMALTEPGGGSDLQAMTTVARREGGEYVVNGAKTWITNSRRAGLIALLCKTDPAAEPGTGASRSCWPNTVPASWSPVTCPNSATRASRAASCPSRTTGCPSRRCWAARRATASVR